jgi:subtilisin family serine protease
VSQAEPFAGRTGKGVRVAVIDSGVHASHHRWCRPRAIGNEYAESNYADAMGHGTAVMAAIKEKAQDAEYFAVRVFYTSLRTTIDLLLRAIEWPGQSNGRNQPELGHNQPGSPGPVHSVDCPRPRTA